MKSRYVNIDPKIMGGEPVFLDEFLDWFPSVTRELAVALLKDAYELLIGGAK